MRGEEEGDSLLSELMMNEEECPSENEAQTPDRQICDAEERILPTQPRGIRYDDSFCALEPCDWVVVIDDDLIHAPGSNVEAGELKNDGKSDEFEKKSSKADENSTNDVPLPIEISTRQRTLGVFP